MQLKEFVENRQSSPGSGNWEKIPWDEPGFSERMLQEHLSQEHDWASRRMELVARQAACIHQQLPPGSAILDLGCGPGLYTQALAAHGHCCTGVDFSPAAIAYARARAKEQGLDISYQQADIRDYLPPAEQAAPEGQRFDGILLLFGEVNAFARQEAQALLQRACAQLAPNGTLFLEVHTYQAVKEAGQRPSVWSACQSGLFSGRPHLLLEAHSWDQEQALARSRYVVVDAGSAQCREYASCLTAYTEPEYRSALQAAGLDSIRQATPEDWPQGETFGNKLFCLVCKQKQAAAR